MTPVEQRLRKRLDEHNMAAGPVAVRRDDLVEALVELADARQALSIVHELTARRAMDMARERRMRGDPAA